MSTTKNANSLVASAWIALAIGSTVPLAAIAQIEEVVVTTRKREENLQDIPLAVSAITAEQIQRQGINSLSDVVASQPSVQFDQSYGPADNRITVRGLSNTRGRSNVAFLIDGIDVTTENLISAGSGLLANRRLLSDVERIEIVKGPQSALCGRQTFGGAVNFITTIITMRAPGMTMFRMSIFSWNTLVTSLLVLMAFPVLAAALFALGADRVFGAHLYDPANGGVILWQHLFWFFGHPEVYVIALPFFGIVTEVFPVFARKPIFGYTGLVLSLIHISEPTRPY